MSAAPAGVIDSHCHLADEKFRGDLEEVVARAKAAGLEGALVILEGGNAAEAAKLAKEAVAKNLTVKQLVEQKGLLKGQELEEVLDLRKMTEIGVPGSGLPSGG